MAKQILAPEERAKLMFAENKPGDHKILVDANGNAVDYNTFTHTQMALPSLKPAPTFGTEMITAMRDNLGNARLSQAAQFHKDNMGARGALTDAQKIQMTAQNNAVAAAKQTFNAWAAQRKAQGLSTNNVHSMPPDVAAAAKTMAKPTYDLSGTNAPLAGVGEDSTDEEDNAQ
jgi:hypothetical protein